MVLRRELLTGIGMLVALVVLVSFGTIGLLTRMTPVIDRILRENVFSIEASEEMLTILAQARDDEPLAPYEARFRAALDRARHNVTEEGELPPLQVIERTWQDALLGDPPARSALIEAILSLSATNRSAMEAADAEARRLGSAGAWVATFIGALALLLSVRESTRISRRVLSPIGELYQTLELARKGDVYRRCTAVDAPVELQQVMVAVNGLLDATAHGTAGALGPQETILAHVLEKMAEPALVLDAQGSILAANDRARARLRDDDGPVLRAALQNQGGRHPRVHGLRFEPIRDTGARLCIFPPSSSTAASKGA